MRRKRRRRNKLTATHVLLEAQAARPKRVGGHQCNREAMGFRVKPTDLGRRFFGICAAVAHDRPWTILAVSLLLTVVAAYAATRLTVSTRDEDIISPESRFVEIARAYAQVFP